MALRKRFQPTEPRAATTEPARYCAQCTAKLEWIDPLGFDGQWVCRSCGYPYESVRELNDTETRYRALRRKWNQEDKARERERGAS